MPDLTPIELTITPSFGAGLRFSWKVYNGVVDPLPWSFYLERCDAGEDGPWVQVTGPLTCYTWQDPERLIISRDAPRFYRIKLVTSSGSYYSDPASIGGSLNLRRFNMAKEVMRREMMYAKLNSNSTLGEVFSKNVSGPPCTTCLDPILGSAVYGTDCPTCGGTKFNPPYLGPYPVYATFSVSNRTVVTSEDGVGQKRMDPSYKVRIAGTAWLRTGDVLKTDGNLYHVETVEILAEVGQLPLIQEITANILPMGDPLYVLDILK
jgi:hypothetical protein